MWYPIKSPAFPYRVIVIPLCIRKVHTSGHHTLKVNKETTFKFQLSFPIKLWENCWYFYVLLFPGAQDHVQKGEGKCKHDFCKAAREKLNCSSLKPPKTTTLQTQWTRSYPQSSLFPWILGLAPFRFSLSILYLTNVLCFSVANVLLAGEIINYKILPQKKPRTFCFLVVPQRSWNAAREADPKGNSEMMWRWGKVKYQTRYPCLHRRLENRSRINCKIFHFSRVKTCWGLSQWKQ